MKVVFDHYTQPAQRLGLGDTLSSGYVAWALKGKGLEPVFYCPHHEQAGLFERFPFSPGRLSDGLLVNPFNYIWNKPLAHIQKDIVEQVLKLDLELDPDAPLLWSTEKPQDYIAFHYTFYRGAGTGKLAPRSLEPDKAKQLIQTLKKFGRVVLLPGAPPTGAEDEVIRTKRIPEFIDVIAGAKLVVGTDSSPLHIANILKRPWVNLTTAHGMTSFFAPRENSRMVSSRCPKAPCLPGRQLDACPMNGPPYLCHDIDISTLESQVQELL